MLSGGAESKCSHSPTKTQRKSTTIRSSFFPCSVMFPPVPLHFHKSRFKTKQRGRAVISETPMEESTTRTSRSACSSGSTPSCTCPLACLFSHCADSGEQQTRRSARSRVLSVLPFYAQGARLSAQTEGSLRI